MSLTLQKDMMAEIMTALSDTLAQAGAAIIGGHSTTGAELSIGLTLTGLTDRPIEISGAQPGDVLILTKPLGSGTIMAADMQVAARGDWVRACLAQMVQGQQQASAILSPQASAMTDVTGFGLAGHVAQTALRSGVRIEIDRQSLPLMTGAAELARSGIRSSLFDSNRQIALELADAGDPQTVLLFDPQTCGGLLAAVPAPKAEGLLSDLSAAGYPSSVVIGQVTTGRPGVTYS